MTKLRDTSAPPPPRNQGTQYGLRHRTSRRWLACNPTLTIPLTRPVLETTDVADAFTCSTPYRAELARKALEEFADCYECVPVDVPVAEGGRMRARDASLSGAQDDSGDYDNYDPDDSGKP